MLLFQLSLSVWCSVWVLARITVLLVEQFCINHSGLRRSCDTGIDQFYMLYEMSERGTNGFCICRTS